MLAIIVNNFTVVTHIVTKHVLSIHGALGKFWRQVVLVIFNGVFPESIKLPKMVQSGNRDNQKLVCEKQIMFNAYIH